MAINIGVYILDGKTPVEVSSIRTWAKWFESADRHVAQSEWEKVRVRTVFLGIDHNYAEGGPPILFETMVFGGEHDGYQERCSTWAQAEEMHARALKMVLEGERGNQKL